MNRQPSFATDTIRYGLLGCGSMGREHLECLRASDGARVVAIADPDPGSRAHAARLAPDARLFERAEELLAAGGCDALIVASPNHTHAATMRAALDAQLPILCEKPVVTTIDDGLDLVRRVRDAAREPRAFVWIAQEYRYMPPVAEALRLARAGELGRIHQVAIREHREPFYPKVGDWNRFSANTGGTLVEKCCHHFNLMELIVGEPAARVFASGGQRVNHLDERPGGRTPDILDSAYAIVEFPGGARACLDLCMFAEGSLDHEQLAIVGDAAKVESLLPSGVVRVGRREDWGRREVWGQPSGTGRGIAVRTMRDTAIRYLGQHFGASWIEHQRFADAVRRGGPPDIPIEEGLRAVAIGLAAHRSIDEGRAVAVDEILPPAALAAAGGVAVGPGPNPNPNPNPNP